MQLCGYVAFVCSQFCHSRQDAEEVVQETFSIAFRKANDIKPEAFLSYLRKVAIHESINKRNATMKQQNMQTELGDQSYNLAELNENFLPEEHFQNEESKAEMLRIIKSLPKRQWEMIYMYYFADFSTKEIAEILGCTIIHVRKTMHLARQKLKDKLDYKKVATKGLVFLPLSALLFIEEQAFAATYIPPPFVGITAVTAATTTGQAVMAVEAVAVAAKVAIPAYIPIACTIAVGVIATVSYIVISNPPEPPPEEYVIVIEEPEVYEPIEYEYKIEYEYEEYIEYEPEYEAELDSVYIPTLPEPPPDPEPEPEVVEEPYIPEPDPMPVDRTSQILSSLSMAGSTEAMNNIISSYGFTFITQTRRHTTTEEFMFFVANEGSGDILIGTVILEDGTGWRMRFQHFENGTMPTDILELLSFME